MDEKEKAITRLTQTEAAYTTLSEKRGQACANCRWFAANGEYGATCHLIDNWPADILPTGHCSRWEIIPAMKPPEPVQVNIEAETVNLVQTEEGAMELDAPPDAQDEKPGLVERLKSLFSRAPQPDIRPGFKVFKQGGKNMWVAWWSNDFQDRAQEIISRKAHDRYIARVDAGFVPLPELWFWHVKGTRHGQAQWIGRIDHMMLAVGEFDDTPIARKMLKHYQKADLAVSFGFLYPRWALKEGVYEDYNAFEISPLPPDEAANPFTKFEDIEMPLTEKKRKALEMILGKPLAEQLIANTEQASKELEEMGLAYKDFADIPAAEAAAQESAAKESPGKGAMGEMFVRMVEAQYELTERQAAVEQELAAAKERQAALEQENQQLRAELALSPRASRADATQLSEIETEALKQAMPVEYDPAFPGMNVPKKS